MKKKILIIAGGGIRHLKPFEAAGRKFGVDLTIASFSNLVYEAFYGSRFRLSVFDRDVASFDVVYIRLVGKRFEELSVLVDYARKHNVRLVDRVYQEANFVRLPYAKSLEVKILHEAGIPVPSTIFGSLKFIHEAAPRRFGDTFVIKDTTGKQGRGVWSPKNKEDLERIIEELKVEENKKKKKFLAQEFIKSSQRTRVFVIGGRAIAAITRPTKWRRRFVEKVNGKVPEGRREVVDPIPKEDADLAVRASSVVGIDIAGVDILHDDTTSRPYILEVNSAPRWDSISNDAKVDVEAEILKFLLEK